MKLQCKQHKATDLGIRATVGLLSDDGREIFASEVKLWHADSRKKFIEGAIKAANGNLTSNERDQHKRSWDNWLIRADNVIKQWSARRRQVPGLATQHSKQEIVGERRQRALELLQDPALLFRLSGLFPSIGLAGETVNALILYLVMTSRLLQRILSAAIKGESSVGKNTLIEKVSRLFPEDANVALSGMSKQALIYSEIDYQHKHIVVAEAEGMRGAEYNFRTLLSEGQLVFQTVEKNESGEFKTRTVKKDGPTGLITATTLPRLHPENETRLISLSLDESEEQTRRVKKAGAAAYGIKKTGADISPWVDAQTILAPVKVQIPFADYLAEHTPDKPLRIRRDFSKLLSLIEASATLHQHQRTSTGDGIIEANLADYFIALTLIEEAFFNSLYGMPPNTIRLMEAIKDLAQTGCDPIETRDLMEKLGQGWGKSKVLRWAKPLKEYDWVIEGGPGRPDRYQVGIDPREKTQRLPTVEELAESFPDLAKAFTIIHPLTGQALIANHEADQYELVMTVAPLQPY